MPLNNQPIFSSLVEHAIELASQWHAQTYRKGSWRAQPFPVPQGEMIRIPVMAHVTAVAMTVQRAGWDDITVAAAFLHDVVEDGNRFGNELAYEELCRLIGKEVADCVLEVTEEKYDEHGNFRKWTPRKIGYIERIKTGSVRAAAISIADKLHNLYSINQSLAKGIDVFSSGPTRRRLSAGPDRQRWFYHSVYEATSHHNDMRLPPMRLELRAEMDRFDQLTVKFG